MQTKRDGGVSDNKEGQGGPVIIEERVTKVNG